MERRALGPADRRGSAAACWGRAEAGLGAAACNLDRRRAGPGGGRASGPRSPGAGGLPSSPVSLTAEPKGGGTGKAKEGAGALEGTLRTRAGAPLAMGEVEISARAYVKMCLHAARYPHAAVNGLLLAPAQRSEECLCLTDCVPLFHSHLALSVMLEVALNQVPPLDAHRPPRSPNTPSPSPSPASWQQCAPTGRAARFRY